MFDDTPDEKKHLNDAEYTDLEPRVRNRDSEKQEVRRGSFFGDLVRFSLLSVVIVLPIRLFIASPFIVNGASMDPTFHTGEYLIIDQISYRFSEPERGDVVVFHYPEDTSKFFIKRIIGLPGEKVAFEGEQIRIVNDENPEGFFIEQPFLEHSSTERGIFFDLKDDEYIVLGDNRAGSSDSRSWGAVKEKLIVGRAFLRLFPLKTASYLPGDVPPSEFQK